MTTIEKELLDVQKWMENLSAADDAEAVQKILLKIARLGIKAQLLIQTLRGDENAKI